MPEMTPPQNPQIVDTPAFKKLLFAWFTAEAGTPSEGAYEAIIQFVTDMSPSAPVGSVTLSARQLQAALLLANPDGDADPARWDTVATLVNCGPFRADDENGVGQDCAAGLYIQFDDMPEEGRQFLGPSPNTAAPAAV